jgi:hypothetical protein
MAMSPNAMLTSPSFVKWAVRFLVAFALPFATGARADEAVTIRYYQPANFYVFQNDNITGSPGENGMFMVYRITSISNDYLLFSQNAKWFDFDLSKLWAGTPKEVSGNTSLDQYFKSAPNKKHLAPGDQLIKLGTIVINVSGDPNKLKTAKVDLHYTAPKGIKVILVREPNWKGPIFDDPMTPWKAAMYKSTKY